MAGRSATSAAGWPLALHLGLYLGRDALGMDASTAVRLVFASAGLWRAGFTAVPVLALRGVPSRAPEPADSAGGSAAAVLTSGFRQLWGTLRGLRTVPLTLLFLCGYWIHTDGIATVTQVAAQYGALELRLARESLFNQLIPPGKEAEYFSLHEIGERSTSWLGPLAFAAIGQTTGSFRSAIVSLIAFFAVGMLLVALLPVRRAVRRAGNRPPRLL